MKKRKPKTASLKYEMEYYRNGYRRIIGVDEAGRGPWAGPLMVGAVALPLDRTDLQRALKGVRDSKLMTANQREGLVETIKEVSLTWGLGAVEVKEIDELGLTDATKLAVERALNDAIERGGFQPDCLFCDFMAWPPKWKMHQLSIVKGDQLSLTIAAASVIAKVSRDAYMTDIAEEFPQYGFEKHKGYHSPLHVAALEQLGPTPIHRRSYAPIRKFLGEDAD